jgi:hypothetical protein
MWFGPTGSYDPAYAFFRFSGHNEQDHHPFVKAQHPRSFLALVRIRAFKPIWIL